MKVLTPLCGLAVLVAMSSPARAQHAGDPSLLPSSRIAVAGEPAAVAPVVDSDVAGRVAELARWMEEFVTWRQWAAEWRNRRQPGWLTTYRERPERPVPPVWLAGRCAAVVDALDALAPACALLAEWSEDEGTALIREARTAARSETEEPSRTMWWKHVHFDLLWPSVQWQARTYGVAGMHVGTAVGRLHVFLTPGVMLVNMPARDGSRVWKVAANYGVGYQLLDFTFPGRRPATLYLNLAKAWIVSDASDLISRRTMDFAGFSIAFGSR